MELEAAAVLQPAGELTEVTAVQVQGDPQGLPAALHLVTHRCVCNTDGTDVNKTSDNLNTRGCESETVTLKYAQMFYISDSAFIIEYGTVKLYNNGKVTPVHCSL